MHRTLRKLLDRHAPLRPATLVLAVVLLCALAGVALGIPVFGMNNLRSPSHTDPNAWYSEYNELYDPGSHAVFLWDETEGAVGYSYSLNHDATDETLDSVEDTMQVNLLQEGDRGSSFSQISDPVLADFDHDGHLDEAHAALGYRAIEVFKGDGNGSFVQPSTPLYLDATHLGTAHRCVVGDFNGDGWDDLAASQGVSAMFSPETGFAIFLNKADGTIGFSAPIFTGFAGEEISGLAASDLNKDGHLDVVALTYRGLVAACMGNGDGTFGTPVVKSMSDATDSTYCEDVALGDVDGDTWPDIVVARYSEDQVGIWWNDGAGALPDAEVAYGVGDGPMAVRIADLDGDGDQDVVAGLEVYGTERVTILDNTGEGRTFDRLFAPDGSGLSDLAVTDMNGDGLLDLVGASYQTIYLWLNNGSDWTRAPLALRSSQGWWTYDNMIAVGDLDRDGRPDLLSTRYSHGWNSGAYISPWMNTPAVIRDLADGEWYLHIRPVDAAGEGGQTSDLRVRIDRTKPEVELSGVVDGGTYLCGSDAQITLQATDPGMPSASGFNVLSYADQNNQYSGEGSPGQDTLTFDLPSDPGIYVYNVTASDNTYNTATMTFAITMVGDVTGLSSPTHPDQNIAYTASTAGFKWNTFVGGRYSYVVDQDPGTEPDLTPEEWSAADPLAYQGTYAGGCTIGSMASGDFNEDGYADYVVGLDDESGLLVQINNGDGTFPADDPSYSYDPVDTDYGWSSIYPEDIVVVDMNDDGHQDLVTANGWDYTFGVMFGNGDGTFQDMIFTYLDETVSAIDVADFDQDGRLDVATVGSENSYYLISFNSTAPGEDGLSFSDAQYFDMGDSWSWSEEASYDRGFMRAADLNHDSKPDVVIGHGNGGFFVARNEIDVEAEYYDFAGESSYGPGDGYDCMGIDVGDLNGDGNMDVVASIDGGTVVVYAGDGEGDFYESSEYSVDYAHAVRIADPNGDGLPDLVIQSDSDAGLRLLAGDGTGGFTQIAARYSEGAQFERMAIGDFNDDGIDDVAAGTTDYDVEIYFGAADAPNLSVGPLDPGVWYLHVRQVGGGDNPIGGATATYPFTIKSDKVTLTYTAAEGGSVWSETSYSGDVVQTLTIGSDATTVTAGPGEGYAFVAWSDGLLDPERRDRNVSEDATYTALFQPIEGFRISAAYPDFALPGFQGFQVNGDASIVDSVFRLTPADYEKSGSVFTRQLLHLSESGFSSFFTFNLHDPDEGAADGLCFVIQRSSAAAVSSGGGMGYDGIAPSVAVEFDTFDNSDDFDDPNNNHVGLDVNGSVVSLVTADAPGGLIEGPWNVWIDFNAATQRLEVRMSTTKIRPAAPTLSATVDIAGIVGNDVYVGVSAATGGAYQAHDLLNFYFSNKYEHDGLNPGFFTYLSGPVWMDGSIDPTATPSGAAATIDVILRDAAGELLADWPVTFSSVTGGTFGETTVWTDSNGRARTTFSPDDAAEYTVRAEAEGGMLIDLTGSVTHAVTYSAGSGGSLEGDPSQVVTHGSDGTTVVAVPDAGKHFVRWSDGVATASRTDKAVTAAIDVAATFAINTYTITPSAGANGSVSPGTAQSVNWGGSKTFTITPDAGYHIADVLVDGVSQGAPGSYTFENVTADHTIAASFAINTYTITPSAGANGSVSPGTAQAVNHGGSKTFTITADEGYHIADVLVDGVSQGAIGSYTFENVTAGHTIAASFAINTYTVAFDSRGGSTVDTQAVEHGAWVTPPSTPARSGYDFRGWYTDPADFAEANRFVFAATPVTASLTLYARWIEVAKVTAVTGTRITFTPTVPGGLFTYDPAYFNLVSYVSAPIRPSAYAPTAAGDLVTVRTYGPVVLEPIKIGFSTLAYVAPSGETQSQLVQISTVVVAPQADPVSGLPSTGGNLLYLLLAALVFVMGGVALRRTQR